MASETRELILKTLRSRGSCTVKDLADAAGISPVSVRHHLSSLQADDLIESEEVRHGVGRPHHVFSLTEDGYELFPTRYYRLTNRLLGELKESLPDRSIKTLLSGVADSMAEGYASQLEGLPLEKRLARLVDLLNEEGFNADIEHKGGEVVLRELSCPYFHVGQSHPEVCLIDQAFIARALSLPVERVRCLLDGDAHCAFLIPIEGIKTYDG
ncbi:MAG: ArsR family transcriptional regulator [Anaerolineales bacterium]|nr:ArsR family transcriptional regulator [Anaerolineales bacterium]